MGSALKFAGINGSANGYAVNVSVNVDKDTEAAAAVDAVFAAATPPWMRAAGSA